MSSSDQPVPERRSGRADLVSRLGVTLDDALLDQALTHRSFAYENGGVPDNERLEDSAGTPLYMEYKGRKVADV